MSDLFGRLAEAMNGAVSTAQPRGNGAFDNFIRGRQRLLQRRKDEAAARLAEILASQERQRQDLLAQRKRQEAVDAENRKAFRQSQSDARKRQQKLEDSNRAHGQRMEQIAAQNALKEAPEVKRTRDAEVREAQAISKETRKIWGDKRQEISTNAEGARGFLRNVEKIRSIIEEAERAKLHRDDLFGVLQGGDGFVARAWRGTESLFDSDAEKYRQRLEGVYSHMELDLAKLMLKGQGAVTDNERAIAAQALGGIGSVDADTALNILDDLSGRSRIAIEKADGLAAAGDVDPFEFERLFDGDESIDAMMNEIVENGGRIVQ